MKIWQVACGELNRDYGDVFLKHDVMLIGPGDPGKFDEEKYRKGVKDKSVTPGHFTQIRSFYKNPKPGDIVLLRLGHRVINIGIIPNTQHRETGGYGWSNAFDDVLGWDLQHYRRVVWIGEKQISLIQGKNDLFSNYKQQATFTAVKEPRILRLCSKLVIDNKRKANSLPDEKEPMSLSDFGIKLFQLGLSNNAVEDVIDAIEKAQRLNSWYNSEQCGIEPSEHEIIAHTTIPLMLALGWSEQFLAVEWNKIDLAFFDRAPRNEKNCVMICEAKRPKQPIEQALEQAKGYVKNKKLINCRRIFLTTGTRLVTYKKQGASWLEDGYVNLTKLRDNYLIKEKVNAVETIVKLLPSRINH